MKRTPALCVAVALFAAPCYPAVKDERPLYSARQLNKAILSDAGRRQAWDYIRGGVEALLYSGASTPMCTAEQFRELSPYQLTEDIARAFAELDEEPIENTPDGGMTFHWYRMMLSRMKDGWAMPAIVALVHYQCGMAAEATKKQRQETPPQPK